MSLSTQCKEVRGHDDPIAHLRIDLAAALRFGHILGLSEGICNHFSVAVPGEADRILINPRGLHWSEIRASDLVMVNEDGTVLHGRHSVEPTALFIHARLHIARPDAKCVLHTHMPYATALCCVEKGRLEWASQNALRYYGRTAYDLEYNGGALDGKEGDRLANALGKDNSILFLSHHGVIVTGNSIAEAFDDLYYLERACMHQVLAQSTGLPLRIIPPAICEKVVQQGAIDIEQAHLHFAALKRILDRESPDYAS
jgi:ribulose-5-phosphate 4-epimerase/fuculose-1-phosphate aldolase